MDATLGTLSRRRPLRCVSRASAVRGECGSWGRRCCSLWGLPGPPPPPARPAAPRRAAPRPCSAELTSCVTRPRAAPTSPSPLSAPDGAGRDGARRAERGVGPWLSGGGRAAPCCGPAPYPAPTVPPARDPLDGGGVLPTRPPGAGGLGPGSERGGRGRVPPAPPSSRAQLRSAPRGRTPLVGVPGWAVDGLRPPLRRPGSRGWGAAGGRPRAPGGQGGRSLVAFVALFFCFLLFFSFSFKQFLSFSWP